MSQPAPNAVLDTIEIVNQGFNSGVNPKLLADNQHWFGVNLTARGGNLKTRPPIRKITLDFHGDAAVDATEARFQGAAYYQSRNNQNLIIASIGGKIFRYAISNDTAIVDDISIATDLNNPNAKEAWLFQGEEFMLINDGLSYPLIFDGASLRRSGGQIAQELPASCMGHYVNGRFVVALPDRTSFIAGDLVGGPSGTVAYNRRDAILKTTENIAILGGNSFAIPLTAGPINALFSSAIPDTSLGQGPLQIGTLNGIFSLNLPLDATQWTTTQQPSSVVALPGFGPVSQSGVVPVMGDAWYRGKDGIRSFVVARRDFGTWVNTPLSDEMEQILPRDTPNLLGYCSAVNFDNRLLMTCSPYAVLDRGVAHRGLIALDFNNISSITSRSQPAYDGLWTGINILRLVTGEFDGVERCFAFALDADDKICLYEVLPTSTMVDMDYNGEDEVPTEAWFISNAQFGRLIAPPQIRLPLKKLVTTELFFSQLAGNPVEFDVKYRSDYYPFWVDWKTFSICAPSTECPSGCVQPEDVQRQYATYVRLPEPSDECNEQTKRRMRTGYQFQLRIQWTGYAQMDRAVSWAIPIPETIPSCPTTTECLTLRGCSENYFTYSIES